MRFALNFLNKLFGQNTVLKALPISRSPLERFLYCLASFVYNQFVRCSFRSKVWFLLLCVVSISWVFPEKCLGLFTWLVWLLENVIASVFSDGDSKLVEARLYSNLEVLGPIAGLTLFLYLSHLGTLMFRSTLLVGTYLYNSGPNLLFIGNVLKTKILYTLWVVLRVVGSISYSLFLSIQRRLSGEFTPIFTEPLSERVCSYFFDSSSKEERSPLMRFGNYVFDAIYRGFLGCSFRVKVLILFVYFLVVLRLVVNNYEWVLSPFWKDSSFASDYTIFFKIGDRGEYPITHGVYSISWLYVVGAGAILCSNLSPERMLRHQYLLLLIPFFRSYFIAVASNVFILLALMLIRACFFYKKRYLYFISIPVVFVCLSLVLLDLTICLEDLGKDNFLRIE